MSHAFADPAVASSNDTSQRPGKNAVREEVSFILQRYMDSVGQISLPHPMPPNIGAAVDWWIKTMQPQERRDEYARQSRNGGWHYPYLDRTADTLKRFLRLTIAQKEIVIAAREDGVYWRGDNMDFFMQVVNETMDMHEIGVPAYRQKAIKKLNALAQNSAPGRRRAA